MNLNFADALDTLGANAAFEFANQARPQAAYLWNTLLPERNEPGYHVDSGFLTVRSAMAGLAATDSPYPPTGITEVSTFIQEAAKLANYVHLPERAIRTIQAFMAQQGQAVGVEWVATEALNFLEKVIVQPHLDAMEWLRSQALLNGEIDWNFGGMNLAVDYGIPTGNILTSREDDDAWDGATSQFWQDIRLIQSALYYNVRAMIMHPDTALAVLNNPVNNIQVQSQVDGDGYTVWKWTQLIGTTERESSDFRNTVEIIAYGVEGEILDITEPGKTTLVPFMQEGKLLAVANNTRTGYRVGEGSTDDPVRSMALGYTHIAPTVEGGGNAGRWAQLYVPEGMPMQLHGRGVTNGIPVIEVPEKIAIASSEIS